MRHAIPTFLLLCGAWVLWSGHLEPKLLGFGLFSCLLVMVIVLRMGIVDEESNPYHLAPRLLVYLPWLFWQIVKSNIDVTRLILHPDRPISPKLIYVRPSQITPIGQTGYANSITLTPGTVTLDVRDGRILVHALTESGAYDLVQGEMDRRATWLEGA